MTKEKVSILSAVVNIGLAGSKLVVGFLIKSSALIADGIHSGLDVVSSIVAFVGIRASEKPADKEHPYGHFRYETIAGFTVAFLLLVSALWIIYEGVLGLIKQESHKIGLLAIFVVIISIVVNEIMARLKFKVGEENNNLALIADAKHSRADSLSSIGVLVGLFFSLWFQSADAITAILVGVYILYETWILGREVTDNLLDMSNPEIEDEIKNICLEEEVNLLEIKTRKIGPQNFAELKIGLNKEWRVEKVEEVVNNLEKLLIEKIERLEFVAIQITSHNLTDKHIKSYPHGEGYSKIRSKKIILEKKGFRSIIPMKDKGICSTFGAPKYMVIDKNEKGEILLKKKVKNPYFHIGKGHSMKFIKDIDPDKVIVRGLGEKAEKELKEMGIEVEIMKKDFAYDEK